MKTILQIQQELEQQGFKLIGGKEWAMDFKVREFLREGKDGSYCIISVKVFGQDVEEDEVEDWEDEFEFRSKDERDDAFVRLHSKYSYDDALLMAYGSQPVPAWLQKEIKERRK